MGKKKTQQATDGFAASITLRNGRVIHAKDYGYVKSDDSIFDFNKIIPMPESLNIEYSTITDQAIAYKVTERLTIPVDQTKLSELISNRYSEDWPRQVVSRVTTWAESATDEEKDKLYAMGKQYVFNKEN